MTEKFYNPNSKSSRDFVDAFKRFLLKWFIIFQKELPYQFNIIFMYNLELITPNEIRIILKLLATLCKNIERKKRKRNEC